MKRLLIYTGLLLAVLIGLTSCYKDIIKPELAVDPDGPPQQVSFANDLAPLFNSSCALAGCHVAGSHKPYLTTNESYIQIVNGGFVNTSLPKKSILYINVFGEMAQYMPSQANRQKVYDWIRNGAPNN
ncbi:MAG: hypothetical protein GC171_08530 [Terrimonas sp.]|nr:hypothetical protein [Terrimonas sp.]